MKGRRKLAKGAALSLAAAVVTIAPPAVSAEPSSNASDVGELSAYLASLGLRDDFEHFLSAQGIHGWPSKIDFGTQKVREAVRQFFVAENVPPPPGGLPD